MAGLAGIAPKNGRLVRPFLCLTREELAAYAKEHHVPYRTDATNADTALTRNFIRAEVVPKLCRVNAQAVEHISETALRLRQEDEYLDSLAAAYLTELKTEAGAVTLPCAALLVMLPLFSPARPPTFSLPETLTAAVHLSTALATENMVS